MSCTISPRGFPRSTSTMGCRPRGSGSLWAIAWSYTIPISPTWETGGRQASLVGIVPQARPASESVDLWTLADRRAGPLVDAAAPAVGRLLASDTRTWLYAAAGVTLLGATLFVAASPGQGRAAAF